MSEEFRLVEQTEDHICEIMELFCEVQEEICSEMVMHRDESDDVLGDLHESLMDGFTSQIPAN